PAASPSLLSLPTRRSSDLLPVVAVMFYTCALTEGNRTPFDNAECEQELIGGYHTEYSAMRMALFLLSEYIHLITASAFFALMFVDRKSTRLDSSHQIISYA